MLNVQYELNAQETANASLDFLTNRPFIKLVFFFMKGSCVMLAAGFMYAYSVGAVRTQDYFALAFASLWLIFYKPVNRALIKFSLRQKTYAGAIHKCAMDANTIMGMPWKKLKYLLQNKDGYIIPLTGLKNAGRFIWLPTRCFNEQTSEQAFLNIVQKHKLKIKKL